MNKLKHILWENYLKLKSFCVLWSNFLLWFNLNQLQTPYILKIFVAILMISMTLFLQIKITWKFQYKFHEISDRWGFVFHFHLKSQQKVIDQICLYQIWNSYWIKAVYFVHFTDYSGQFGSKVKRQFHQYINIIPIVIHERQKWFCVKVFYGEVNPVRWFTI